MIARMQKHHKYALYCYSKLNITYCNGVHFTWTQRMRSSIQKVITNGKSTALLQWVYWSFPPCTIPTTESFPSTVATKMEPESPPAEKDPGSTSIWFLSVIGPNCPSFLTVRVVLVIVPSVLSVLSYTHFHHFLPNGRCGQLNYLSDVCNIAHRSTTSLYYPVRVCARG